MYVCMYVCMYVWVYGCICFCVSVFLSVSMSVCVYVNLEGGRITTLNLSITLNLRTRRGRVMAGASFAAVLSRRRRCWTAFLKAARGPEGGEESGRFLYHSRQIMSMAGPVLATRFWRQAYQRAGSRRPRRWNLHIHLANCSPAAAVNGAADVQRQFENEP